MQNETQSIVRRLLFLSVIGIGVSLWLLYHHVEVRGDFQVGASFCDVNALFSCTSVAQSPYSVFLGLPLAVWGALFYSFFSLVCLIKPEDSAPFDHTAQASALFLLSVVALLPTLALALISVLLLQSICLMCALLYLINVLLFVLAWRSPHRSDSVSSGITYFRHLFQGRLIARKGALWSCGFLILAALLLLAEHGLRTLYFLPRQERLQAVATLEPIYKQWQSEPVVEGMSSLTFDGTQRDFVKGSQMENALVLVEFSDFQCPHCRKASFVLDKIVKELGESVAVVFKHYPLDPGCNPAIAPGYGHEFACRAAKMAHCAGVQDPEKFWQMHDALFSIAFWSSDVLDLLPEEAGLDTEAFADCLNAEQTAEKIRADLALGTKGKVQGTPTFYLNGKRLDILQLAALQPFLEYVLARSRP